jgi:hypothetical protein
MAKTKKRRTGHSQKNESVFSTLWSFVEENPQVALALAFEIGALINEATRSRGNVKGMLIKQLEKGANLLPELLAGQEHKIPPALKILAGPALQAALVAAGSKPMKTPRKKAKRAA